MKIICLTILIRKEFKREIRRLFLFGMIKYSRNPIKQPGEIERGHLMGVGRLIRICQELV